ncbi:MAG: hypothetical protein U1E89_02405 [Burkholderiaceae bacterium]
MRRAPAIALLAWAALSTAVSAADRAADRAAVAPPRVLDTLRDASAWQASGSDQVRASLRRARGGGVCLDYDFAGVAGYAVLRRELPLQWPAQFELAARVSGRGPANDLQIKLVDAGGDNVWWYRRPAWRAPAVATELRMRRRHLAFAWGPAADRTLRESRHIEFVIAAAQGGAGSLCLHALALAERAAEPAQWPALRQHVAGRIVDVDFGALREFNGVVLRWPHGAAPLDYDVQLRDARGRLVPLRRVRGSDGGLDALLTPEREARALRIVRQRGRGQPEVALRSAAQWPDANAVLAERAAEAPRGDLPRAYVGQQNYWTLVGVDGGGERSALLSEDGALELGRGGFSLEPAVQLDDGQRITWAQVAPTQSLRDGYLPQPSVHWRHDAFTLAVQAGADGPREAPELLARWVLTNRGATARRLRLLLAVRPWQVNPPQQFLATQGGASPVHRLRRTPHGIDVNGRRALRFSATPQRVSAAGGDAGLDLATLAAAAPLTVLDDRAGQASALLRFDLELAPGASGAVAMVAPLAPRSGAQRPSAASAEQPPTDAAVQSRLDAAAEAWRARLDRVRLHLPPAAQPVADTLRSALAQVLLSRDGAALRPGTRSYARSWIRDGAMMASALLRMGETDAAREFADWFAPRIFASGKVPCCIDARGADPVVENDSHGEYLFLVAEQWRHGGDRALLERHWPTVQRVVAWMESLRQSGRDARLRGGERAHLFGLMPPSISHEGYSDKPAYSYWDDFWALRGYKDAVTLAAATGHADEARRWAGWRDEFERELAESVAATARAHGIGWIAGAADRGDFDATSTTVAVNVAQAALPAALLEATFERYWREAQARAQGQLAWKDYTPYELRHVGTAVRLGHGARAHELLAFHFAHRRPPGWNQWAEVVLPDAREPRFLGDMPHAWVSADYIASALDLFAYERERDGAIVLPAGANAAWIAQGDVAVQGLATSHGALDYALRRRAGGWTLQLQRCDAPARLVWPGDAPLPAARAGSQALPWQGRELALPAAPALIELEGA